MAARFLVVVALAALVALVPSASAVGKQSTKTRLKPFANCAALVRYARRHAATELGESYARGAPAMGAAEPAAGLADSSSTTNVQEAGVDEPDMVKSQGTTIFALADGTLHAVDTSGEKPRLLDSLDLPSGGDELLVSGSRALVISGGFGGYWGGGGMAIAAPAGSSVGWFAGTVLTEIDISDPSALRVVRTENIDGDYLSARLSGTTARVVVSSYPSALSKRKLRRRARGWRPMATLRTARTGRKVKRPLGSCRSIRRPKVFSGLDALTVMTIDMEKGLPQVDSDSILTDGRLVYGSPDNLYVATERWLTAPASSKEQPPALTTAIHKFDASAPDETTYRASGEVTGSLLSQWSMSDHAGALRVASTNSPEWWDGAQAPQSESFVTVLTEQAGRLVEVGRVGGLGRGEDIYAVRFIGDTGYVVTFRQVDPLYTLDLSQPAHPRVAGELKISGYSAYLHPLGGHLLLGVGQDVSEQGRTLGTQLSLFDVSDPANPVRLQHRVIADSESDVEFDHHAFLWWAPSKLAVLPVWGYGDQPFAEAIGFSVDRTSGIDEVGRTSHHTSEISRALVIDGRLFTVSAAGVARNDLGTLDRLAWVEFPPKR